VLGGNASNLSCEFITLFTALLKCLNDLEWLHLAKEALPKASRAEFRLWNVTEKGLQELSGQDAG
jgi:hypothetical protein